jgi:hypothetical protein
MPRQARTDASRWRTRSVLIAFRFDPFRRPERSIALAKSRQLDRPLTKLSRAVGVRADCRDLTREVRIRQVREAGRRPTAVWQDKRHEVRGGRKTKSTRASATKRSVHFLEVPCGFSQGIAASKLLAPRAKRSPARSHNRARWRAFRPFCPGQAPWHTAAVPLPRLCARA